MKYYKKLNSIGEVEWLVEAEEVFDADSIEITKQEYDMLKHARGFNDDYI
jgi:hypothetical protein